MRFYFLNGEKMQWQLSMGRHDYDWFCKNLEEGIIFQYPKGTAKMKQIPQIGDKIFVSCRGELICEAKMIIPFTEEEDATLFIVNVYKNPIKLKGQRRNWTKLSTEKMLYITNVNN